MKFDMLNEINKVAATKAANALSQFLSFPVGVDVETVETSKMDTINASMPPQTMVVGLNIPLHGSLNGVALLVYPEKSALALCDFLFHRKKGETKQFSELEISALKEMGNIVIGNFLMSFSTPLKIGSLIHGISDFNHESFTKFITPITNELTENACRGVIHEIMFHFKNTEITGTGIFLFPKKELDHFTGSVS